MAEEARHLTSIGKVNIYFRSSEDCHACYEELRTLPLSFAMPEETTLEMTAQGVTKGSGLKALADYLHIPMAQTVGIGDSDNDRAMLHDVGLSVAMATHRRISKRSAICHRGQRPQRRRRGDPPHSGALTQARKEKKRGRHCIPQARRAMPIFYSFLTSSSYFLTFTLLLGKLY